MKCLNTVETPTVFDINFARALSGRQKQSNPSISSVNISARLGNTEAAQATAISGIGTSRSSEQRQYLLVSFLSTSQVSIVSFLGQI